MPAITEFHIHRAVVIHLRKHCPPGVVWWHTPNGEARNPVTGKRLKDMGVQPGIPDLLFLKNGKMYGLELKKPGCKLSDSQCRMQDAMLDAGMMAFYVVDNLPDVIAFLHRFELTSDTVQGSKVAV